MDNLERILCLLFKHISAKMVLNHSINAQRFDQKEFVNLAFVYMREYSEIELQNLWLYYKDIFQIERNTIDQRESTQSFSVFDALFCYIKKKLIVQNNEIMCRYDKLMNWRMLTFEISEDLLIAAYLAQKNRPEETMEMGFTWKTVIGHNNSQLNRIMERGISENHFHLYGSAPMFSVSWISLMNNVCRSKSAKYLKKYDYERRYSSVHYNASYKEESLVVQHYQAVLIRIFLFSKLMNRTIQIGEINLDEKKVEECIENQDCMEEILSEIQMNIDVFRNDNFYDNKELEDYALFGMREFCEVKACNNIFAGERWFLYSCLHKIYRSEFPEIYVNWFYAYLLIKEVLRSELIQSNQNVGFINFQKYQNRKMELVDDIIFKTEMVKWAVRENMLNSNIKSLEIRIHPQNMVKKNIDVIKQLDYIIGKEKKKYFYTFHFSKSSDEEEDNYEFSHYRHYKKRRSVKKLANVIVAIREQHPKYAKRILGIDAASSEIGCRPEVFASSFRYLRNHIKILDDGLNRKELPQLRVTYHVGEDFLDIADGLRAIDEAINFLNMESGDRMGHALALGLDVEEWYCSKNNKILIPQQDYLDTLVWMYHALIRFDIPGMSTLSGYIEEEYDYYFYEIYRKYIDFREIKEILKDAINEYKHLGVAFTFQEEGYAFNLSEYYQAWKLRGDDPCLYENGYFKPIPNGVNIEQSYINQKFPERFNIRYMPQVFLLNYLYHFNSDIKKAGRKRIEINIMPYYIQGVKLIQKELQKRISEIGIAIETNPSSNYLIGTFKDYAKHPIFNFYNKELTLDTQILSECPQISVSVNTDDMGVFSTSLENEYGLLANALENLKDDHGKPLYNQSMIYEWINRVRKFGNQQSFFNKKYYKEKKQKSKNSF